jgi:hypothetical protein
VAAWVELVELLRARDYIETSRCMAERAETEGPAPDGGHEAAAAIEEHAGAAVRAGILPDSAEALVVIERVEALTPGGSGNRLELAARLETFADRRTVRYWTLVGIVNDWPQARATGVVQLIEAWEWIAAAIRPEPATLDALDAVLCPTPD